MSSTAAIIRSILDNVETDTLITRAHVDRLTTEIVTALDDRGLVLKKKPAPRATKPAEPVEVFAPNTGNPELDAFMRKSHRPDWRERLRKATARNRPGMIPMPTPAPGLAKRPMTQTERRQLLDTHLLRGRIQ